MDGCSPNSTTSVSHNAGASSGNVKQAACLNCRRSKIRCLRHPTDIRCKRCTLTDADCVIPDYHVGRKKGIKNKRTGLDKAVHRIEQAIKESKTQHGHRDHRPHADYLQDLLNEVSPLATNEQANAATDSTEELRETAPLVDPASETQQKHVRDPALLSGHRDLNHDHDSFSVDDAENPLQLLARASDISVTSLPSGHHASTIDNTSRTTTDLGMFFGPFRPRLDVGEDIDPVDIGFVTLEETKVLFTYFYQNLSHTRWGLDPHVHTAEFVRSRSAFLFTSVLAASSLFLPAASALSKRLSAHCIKLAHHVISHRHRSPEIVLAFMVNVPWMSPGKHWTDDQTCTYVAMALTIAMDISLNKIIVPSDPLTSVYAKTTSRSECISARKALDLDGFEDVDPRSAWGQRLLRRRERIWLALFVLDRGVCLARGRSFSVPVTPLIETCDRWHVSDLADIWDGSIISSATMRRDLVRLISDIKTICDGDQTRRIDGSSMVESLHNMIENFFGHWHATWTFSEDGIRGGQVPPYVEILVCHTRLSTYSSVINHPSAPLEVKRFFRAAGLSSSLNVMRAAVQGESRLKSMPNNTAIMISFAACFALSLIALSPTAGLNLAPSIKVLIEETADVLERIGSTPAHRRGSSALYGSHLRDVVSNISGLDTCQIQIHDPGEGHLQSRSDNSTNIENTSGFNHGGTRMPCDMSYLNNGVAIRPGIATARTLPYPAAAPRAVDMSKNLSQRQHKPLQFSAMSDYQIIETINNADQDFGIANTGSHANDAAGLDWLDWFSMDVAM